MQPRPLVRTANTRGLTSQKFLWLREGGLGRRGNRSRRRLNELVGHRRSAGIVNPVTKDFVLLPRQSKKLQTAVKVLLIFNCRARSNRLAYLRKKDFNSDGLTWLQFTGCNCADATLAEVDRTSGNGFWNARFKDNNINRRRHVIPRQRSPAYARVRGPSWCSGRHHW